MSDNEFTHKEHGTARSRPDLFNCKERKEHKDYGVGRVPILRFDRKESLNRRRQRGGEELFAMVSWELGSAMDKRCKGDSVSRKFFANCDLPNGCLSIARLAWFKRQIQGVIPILFLWLGVKVVWWQTGAYLQSGDH